MCGRAPGYSAGSGTISASVTWPVPATNRAKRSLVTGSRSIQNPSTETRCAGRSSGIVAIGSHQVGRSGHPHHVREWRLGDRRPALSAAPGVLRGSCEFPVVAVRVVPFRYGRVKWLSVKGRASQRKAEDYCRGGEKYVTRAGKSTVPIRADRRVSPLPARLRAGWKRCRPSPRHRATRGSPGAIRTR